MPQSRLSYRLVVVYYDGLGSPLPGVATPSIALIYSSRTASHKLKQNSIAHINFKQNSISNIYFSRTASPVYSLAEQHRMFVYASWEWRPLGVAACHHYKTCIHTSHDRSIQRRQSGFGIYYYLRLLTISAGRGSGHRNFLCHPKKIPISIKNSDFPGIKIRIFNSKNFRFSQKFTFTATF